MLSVSSVQLNAWMVMLLWPAARILAMITVAPLFGHTSVPVTVKLALGMLLATAIAPGLPPMPEVAPFSGDGLLVLVQQMLIGLAIGFAMRLVFASVELAGELAALSMGLSFSSFFDPLSQAETSSVSQFFGWLALMVFIASNLHLAMLATLAKSFVALPVSAAPMGTAPFRLLASYGSHVFALGLQLALPVIAALLVTNLALGILNKAAPQLNLFGIGFPVTLGAGFLMIAVALPYLSAPLLAAMEHRLSQITAALAGAG
jgi:flagellar biosynthetic protein FliR